jgi:hypothetical protein
MTLLSVVLGLIPLLGIVWTFLQGDITTVGGLFLTLILLSLSAILLGNALMDIRRRMRARNQPARKAS